MSLPLPLVCSHILMEEKHKDSVCNNCSGILYIYCTASNQLHTHPIHTMFARTGLGFGRSHVTSLGDQGLRIAWMALLVARSWRPWPTWQRPMDSWLHDFGHDTGSMCAASSPCFHHTTILLAWMSHNRSWHLHINIIVLQRMFLATRVLEKCS